MRGDGSAPETLDWGQLPPKTEIKKQAQNAGGRFRSLMMVTDKHEQGCKRAWAFVINSDPAAYPHSSKALDGTTEVPLPVPVRNDSRIKLCGPSVLVYGWL